MDGGLPRNDKDSAPTGFGRVSSVHIAPSAWHIHSQHWLFYLLTLSFSSSAFFLDCLSLLLPSTWFPFTHTQVPDGPYRAQSRRTENVSFGFSRATSVSRKLCFPFCRIVKSLDPSPTLTFRAVLIISPVCLSTSPIFVNIMHNQVPTNDTSICSKEDKVANKVAGLVNEPPSQVY